MPLVFLAGLLSAVLWYFDFGIIAMICGYLSFISFAVLCRSRASQTLFVILIATGYKIFVLPRPTGLFDHLYLLGPALGGAVATYMILLPIIFFAVAIGAWIYGRIFDSEED